MINKYNIIKKLRLFFTTFNRELANLEEDYRRSQDPNRANIFLDKVANLYHSATKEIETDLDPVIINQRHDLDEEELEEVKIVTYF